MFKGGFKPNPLWFKPLSNPFGEALPLPLGRGSIVESRIWLRLLLAYFRHTRAFCSHVTQLLDDRVRTHFFWRCSWMWLWRHHFHHFPFLSIRCSFLERRVCSPGSCSMDLSTVHLGRQRCVDSLPWFRRDRGATTMAVLRGRFLVVGSCMLVLVPRNLAPGCTPEVSWLCRVLHDVIPVFLQMCRHANREVECAR